MQERKKTWQFNLPWPGDSVGWIIVGIEFLFKVIKKRQGHGQPANHYKLTKN